MKFKKVLVIFMAVCLSISMFAACGSDENATEATKAPASKAPASSTVAPSADATKAPTAEPTEKPTEKPTAAPFVEDPEVDAILYRFHYADKYMWEVEDFMSSDEIGVGQTALGAACNYWYEEGEGLAVEVLLEDPYFMILGTESGEPFNLADYPVLKIRLKNETLAAQFEAFICAKTHAQAGEEFRVDISSEDTEYKEYIVDFTQIKDQAYLDGKAPVGGIRMDTVHITGSDLSNSESTTVYIDYFGFFKTVEDAQNWNPSHVTPVEAPATDAPATDAADATAEATEVVEG